MAQAPQLSAPPPEASSGRTRSWSNRIRIYLVNMLFLLITGLLSGRLVQQVLPALIKALNEFNEMLINEIPLIYPWHLLEAYVRDVASVTEIWPHDADAVYKLSSLIGRMIGALIAVPITVLAEGNTTAISAVVGFGLGALIAYTLLETYGRDEPNPLLVGLGGIVLGGICLWILKLLMVMATGLFGWFFSAAGLVAAFSVSYPLVRELLDIILNKASESIVEKVLAPLEKHMTK